MNKIACIVGGVKQNAYVLPQNSFIIAADQGYMFLKEQGITADLAVGDFDSLGFVPTDITVIRHPVEKDDTDTMLAVREGLRRGCKAFILYGCTGGDRPDHTLANIQALAFIASQGAIGFMCDQNHIITVIQNSKLLFDAHERGSISVFCLGADCEGVDIKGLKYQMTNGILSCKMPLGVSNEFIGENSMISVKSGMLCIIWKKSIHQLLADLQC